jgi:hypothetical protein
VGALIRQRPGHMVVDLDLEEKTARKEKLRTSLATGASTVENTVVLGLGFNPNRHIKERNKKVKATNRSGDCEAQGRAERRRLAGAYSVAGAQVIAHTGMTQ